MEVNSANNPQPQEQGYSHGLFNVPPTTLCSSLPLVSKKQCTRQLTEEDVVEAYSSRCAETVLALDFATFPMVCSRFWYQHEQL